MFDAATFATHVDAVDNAVTNQEKGNSLEGLSSYLFNSIDGIEVREKILMAQQKKLIFCCGMQKSHKCLSLGII